MEILFGFFYTIIIAVILAALIKKGLKKNDGKKGERIVSNALAKIGFLFDDYYTVDQKGNTHQIDHILVNEKGVFVIETKDYSGRIYGSDEQREWTQVLAYGKEKHRLYNPVKQNETHVREIKRILGKYCEVNSVVIFVSGDITHVRSRSTWDLYGGRRYINSFPVIYDEYTVNEIVQTLANNRVDIDPKEHIRNVKRKRKTRK